MMILLNNKETIAPQKLTLKRRSKKIDVDDDQIHCLSIRLFCYKPLLASPKAELLLLLLLLSADQSKRLKGSKPLLPLCS